MFSIYTETKKEIPSLTGLRSPVRRSEQHEWPCKLKHFVILTQDAVRRVANLLCLRLNFIWNSSCTTWSKATKKSRMTKQRTENITMSRTVGVVWLVNPILIILHTVKFAEALRQEAHGSYRSIRQSYQKTYLNCVQFSCENVSPHVRK